MDKIERPGAQVIKKCATCKNYDADKRNCAAVKRGVSAVCTQVSPPEVHRVKVTVAPDFGCVYWAK